MGRESRLAEAGRLFLWESPLGRLILVQKSHFHPAWAMWILHGLLPVSASACLNFIIPFVLNPQ
jgi:hypothetical protein